MSSPQNLGRLHGFFKRAALRSVLGGLVFVLSACSVAPQNTPTQRSPGLAPAQPSDTRSSEPGAYNTKRNDLALFAMSLLDTTYAWGGRGPATGFDCSGLVTYIYKEAAGLPVKGSAADLGKISRPIVRERMQAGDLLFFNTLGARHSHVGIYVGSGRFVHASNPRTGVRMDLLSNRYYASRFEGAATLLD